MVASIARHCAGRASYLHDAASARLVVAIWKEAKVNCPVCLERDVVFPMQVGSVSATIVAPELFTDERGLAHMHDPTVTVTAYSCPVGHQWSKSECRTCWCGWRAA